MKLYYDPASPYLRKVRVLAIETGLVGEIELAKVTIAPTGPDAHLCADNLDVLEGGPMGDGVDIGTISVACAPGYLDFRYSDERWRDSRPKLTAWFEKFAQRPSMSETSPE